MTTKIEFKQTVSEEFANQRLDKALASLLPDYSRSLIKQWIEQGMVTVDGQNVKAKQKLEPGQRICVAAECHINHEIAAQAIDIVIAYEDEYLMIINKPAGMVVHPGAGNPDKTLQNALLYHRPQLSEVTRAGLIHRLDKDTSGLLIVAKTVEAHTHLVKLLQDRHIHRHYVALVKGHIVAGSTIDEPIARHPRNRLKMAVSNGGKAAITHYRVLERFEHYSYLAVKLETGRTHQIRVHFSQHNLPIVGDELYAGRRHAAKCLPDNLRELLHNFPRQALHACKLEFIHPILEKNICVSADIPQDMQQLLNELRATKSTL